MKAFASVLTLASRKGRRRDSLHFVSQIVPKHLFQILTAIMTDSKRYINILTDGIEMERKHLDGTVMDGGRRKVQ